MGLSNRINHENKDRIANREDRKEWRMEENREGKIEDLLYFRFLPRLPVPPPLAEVVMVVGAAGGSFLTLGGGEPTRFCDFCDCCTGGGSTGFDPPVSGFWVGNDAGVILLGSGMAGGNPIGP